MAVSTPRIEKHLVRLIKRYASGKHYDTTERRFTTLARIGGLVRDGTDVLVVDHDTGADETAHTLRQALRHFHCNPDDPIAAQLSDMTQDRFLSPDEVRDAG